MFIAASTDVSPGDSGIASGLASTALQIGTAAGLALLVGIATADLGDDGAGASHAAIADGLRTGLYVIAAGALAAIPAALALANRRDAAAGGSAQLEPPTNEP